MTIPANNTRIAAWLLICSLLVFSMILLGGATRLTQSGLSMVEWDPIMGVIPPLSDEQWADTFEKYQAFPEYQIINRGMTLEEFKRIFYMEYAHRVLGRTIGLVFLLPFLFFALTRALTGRLALKLAIMFVLGGLQGLMGWYMVKSGLVDAPHVSAYRLTAHLMLAVLIVGYMLWVAYDLLRQDNPPPRVDVPPGMKIFALIVLAAVTFMIFTGGFVAGIKAGYAFNTYPKMYDQWVPDGLWAMQPVWRNLFENVATVQFVHRCMALLLAALVVGFWFALGRMRAGWVRHVMLLVLIVQFGLGVTTLLYLVPVPLAVAHQGGALVLFSLVLLATHQLLRSAGRQDTH